MSITYKIDTRNFEKQIRQFAANTNKDLKDVMRDEMRLLTERIIQLTPPPHGKGGGKEAQRVGENRVDKDIRKIFVGAEQEYIQKWGSRFPYFKTSGGGFLLFQENVEPQIHQQLRDKRGRVNRKGTRTIKVGELLFADKVHVPKQILARYIKMIAKHVGRAKAGWNAAAMLFKAKGVPSWVSRHGASEGVAREVISNKQIFLEAENRNKAIAALDRQARIIRNALAGRERDIAKKIQNLINVRARGAFAK
jgi:hypothetical protein